MEIKSTAFRYKYAENNTYHGKIAPKLHSIVERVIQTGTEINEVLLYNLQMHAEKYNAGTSTRLVLFFGATPISGSTQTEARDIVLGDQTFQLDVMNTESHDFMHIKDDNGTTIALYNDQGNELYFPYELFKTNMDGDITEEQLLSLVKHVLVELQTSVFEALKNKDSWTKTTNKERLMDFLKKKAKEEVETQVIQLRERTERGQSEMDMYRNKMQSVYKQLILDRQQLEQRTEELTKGSELLITEMELIAGHPRFRDVIIKEDKYILDLPDVYAYDGDNRYYIGDFLVEIKYDTSDVKFLNQNNRRNGYWTGQDNHPHVNGQGRACLGNVSATIAELSAQKQFFALALTALDFLESVNTEDPAGRKVANWDLVDEEGNVIQKGGIFTCYVSGEDYPMSEGYQVFDHYSFEDGESDAHMVHGDHLDDYVYWDSLGEYIHKNYDERMFFDEDGDTWEDDDLITDYEGRDIPEEHSTRVYMEFSRTEGVKNPQYAFTPRIEEEFVLWESLGEYVHKLVRESDFYNENGDPIDSAGNVIAG